MYSASGLSSAGVRGFGTPVLFFSGTSFIIEGLWVNLPWACTEPASEMEFLWDSSAAVPART